MKFRKKPVVIDAVQWDGDKEPILAWLDSFDDRPDRGVDIIGDVVRIYTLEGTMTASRGDWIIRGVKGELYPCKPDIFEATYEREPPEPTAVPGGGKPMLR